MRRVDAVRFGRAVRALRQQRGWRQEDLAAAARVSRAVVSRIERGQADRVPVARLEQVAAALGARMTVRLDWNGQELDRLLDRRHAALVDALGARLRALRWAVAWMGTGGVLAFLFGERVVSAFTADPEVVAAAVVALRALSLALPFWALWFVGSGGLRGSGDTRTPLIVGSLTMWLSVLVAWIAVRWFGGGLGWVWFSFVLTTSPASVLMWRAFRGRIGDYEQGRREWPVVPAAVAAH